MTTLLPRAILFDLDETILTFGPRMEQLLAVAADFVTDGAVGAEALARVVDARFAAFWADEARHKAWRSRLAEAREAVVVEAFAELAAAGAVGLTPEAARRFSDAFHALRASRIAPFPDALDAVDKLRAAGVKLALITNGPTEVQRAKIERFDLARRFDHIQVEGECGFGKPEPQAYQHALDALGVASHEAWIVGDNLEWEVAAPQRLGLYAVWCDGYGVGLPAGGTVIPDRIIRSLAELLASA
jgi:putative hydrolase of the HAD superfamily